jgi:FkbH-like protein
METERLHAPAQATTRQALTHARSAAASGDHEGAFAALRGAITPDSDFVDQARIASCLQAIDLKSIGLRTLRVALVAASTLDHFAPVFRFWLADAGFDAQVLVTPFDTTAQSVLDPDSTLHRWKPDVVWLFATHRDIRLDLPPNAAPQAISDAVSQCIKTRQALWQSLQQRIGCLVVDNTADLPADDPFGNLAGAAPWGRRTLLRRYNIALTDAAPPGVVLFDLDHQAALWGKRRWDDPRYWFHSRHAFALDATGPVAHAAARLLAGARGTARKCLVLDLDNTLWGGVIGDDGLTGIQLGSGAEGEAFLAFQVFVKALKDRGVILAVCSKNDPEIASSVFRYHPDSMLRLEDFAVFTANWDNKADNIRDIATRLNIGLDALVFVDDNRMERDLVRHHLPQVAVVDLPDDPSGFVAALARGNWFEAVGFSAEDQARNRYYADDARRTAERAAFVDMEGYLRGLDMVATVGGADPFHLPRMAQLIGKSNQFHLTGTRYNEAELAAFAADPAWIVRYVRLADRFGDNGLIACLVLRGQERTLHIDTWVMSCRVLGRTVEEFIANTIADIGEAHGCTHLTGRYVRSPKNGLVAGLYDRLGFARVEETASTTTWTLDLDRARWTTWVNAAKEPPHA